MSTASVLRSTVSGAIGSVEALRERVDQANDVLGKEVGRSSGTVTAAWDLVNDDAGPTQVRLVLKDLMTNAQAMAKFAPEELANDRHLVTRLSRLWGDLLQARSHRQLEELVGSPDHAGR